MKINPETFLTLLKEGKTEFELNRTESLYVDPIELKRLTSKNYGHSIQSATEHLTTDYSNGYTICKKCGSFYELGKGFTKHLSDGCLFCEGEPKHRIYYVNASERRYGGFPARYMCIMFDDGMHYTKDNLEIEKYKSEVN